MIWSMEQIYNIMRLRPRVEISEDYSKSGPSNLIDLVGDKLIKRLKHLAEPYAVNLDFRDISIGAEYTDPSDPHSNLIVMAGWYPKTKRVQFAGGYLDGMEMEVLNIWHPLVTSLAPDSLRLFEFHEKTAPGPDDVVETKKVIWCLSGWNEDKRMWVFTPEGP